MAAEKDSFFKSENLNLSKTDVPALAREEKTEFEKAKALLEKLDEIEDAKFDKEPYGGYPRLSEQAKAKHLLGKLSACICLRNYATIYGRGSWESSNSSSSSSRKTATTAAEAGLAVSETAAASKTRSREKAVSV